MSEDEARDGCLERTSFPLFHPKKSKMLSRSSSSGMPKFEHYGATSGMGEASRNTVAPRRETGPTNSGDDRQEILKRRQSPNPSLASTSSAGHVPGDGSGMNAFLMNPLLAMGFQLPQLALLMQQQQNQSVQQNPQQQQPRPAQHPNLNLPTTTPSMLNPLLLPHMLANQALSAELAAAHQKAWPSYSMPENIPTVQATEPRTGTIMSASVNTNAVPHVSVKGSSEKQPIVAHTKEDSGPGKQPFVCELCREWFFSREKLVMHLVMNHRMHHCHFCAELFESVEMRNEHEAGIHLPLECDICQTSLPSADLLSQHYLISHDVRNCQFCGVLVRPKSYYAVHVRRKHFVAPDVMVDDSKVRIMRHWDSGANGSSAWTFTCHLCGKERKRTETFGHFYSYHRLSLSCLIQLLASEGVAFSVQGTPAPSSSSNVQNSSALTTAGSDLSSTAPAGDDSSNNDASRNSGTSVSGDESQQQRCRSSNPSSSCTVCTNPFSVQVPKPAHDLFCKGLTLCRYCDRTFTSKAARNSHVVKDHGDLVCRVGCSSDVSFSQEYELSAHYLQDHNLHMCHYCTNLVPAVHNQFPLHLKKVHKCSEDGSALKDLGNGVGVDLFQCKYSDVNLSVTCVLCNTDITLFMNDIHSLFKHIEYHSIGLQSALHLLETNLIFDTELCSVKGKRSIEQDFRDLNLAGNTSSYWSKMLLGDGESGRRKNKSTVRKPVVNPKKVCYSSDQEQQAAKPRATVLKSLQNKGADAEGTVRGIKKHSKDLAEKNGDRLAAGIPITDETNFDSSSDLLSSEDEDLASEGEGVENDLSEEEDDDYVSAENKSKQAPVGLESDNCEAEFDPNEVECVFSDTSDEEGEDPPIQPKLEIKEEEEENSYSNSEGTDEQRQAITKKSGGDDLVEKTMKEIFGDGTNSDTSLNKTLGGEKEVVIKQEPEDETSELQPKSSGTSKEDTSDTLALSGTSGKTTTCEICQGSFISGEGSRELARHMSSLHGFALPSDRGQDPLKLTSQNYHCHFCPVQTVSRPAMRQHLSKMHGSVLVQEKPLKDVAYKCRFCDIIFWKVADRDEHQVINHADQMANFFKCYVCSKVYSSKLCLQRHVESEHSDKASFDTMAFKCKVCLTVLPGLTLLRQHFQEKHPASLVFHCYRCNTTLKTKKTLRSHIKNVHSEARRRECNLCGKVLWSKRAHAIHYRMKHSVHSKVGFRCRICQKRFDSKDERKLHYQVDHEGESPYHCSECGKGFASKSGMYGHRQLHTGSGISKCEYCGKEFTRKDSYNEHLLIHNGPRHKCPHCPKEFVQRSNLVRHIRIHTGEKPYKCLYCDKCFSDKGACNSHIRVHTREETCSCPYCGQTFSKKQKLKYHIRKHTGEGLISCEICSKSFTNSFALKEHRVIHNRQTQILCQMCGKGFNSEKYLQRHVTIVHEPSKAFSCPLCPKVFSQQARLKAHLMTHTGVKHIKCLLCDKAYSVRKSLRRHLQEKHSISPEHPQYKHCFYAMTAEEAGLHIPEGAGPFVGDDDSTSQSFPHEEEEEKGKKKESPSPVARKFPRKTPGRKGPTRRGVTKASAPFEVYAGEPGEGEGEQKRNRRRVGRKRSSSKHREGEGGLSSNPSTSTSDSPRKRGRPPKKLSPAKIVRKEETEFVPSDESGSSNLPESACRREPVIISPPVKDREQERTEGYVVYPDQQPELGVVSLPPLSPRDKTQSVSSATGRKKRRVEAIVEILHKTGSSPSSVSTKEEDEGDDDEENEEDKKENITKNVGSGLEDIIGIVPDSGLKIEEESSMKGESESDDDTPVLAKILPLNSPKKCR
ncbi:Protein suppressor of hairy wing [Gryllus bimaculatus]|nr:Protein suppressor of hairy wing [Gryllus bimaculatus]